MGIAGGVETPNAANADDDAPSIAELEQAAEGTHGVLVVEAPSALEEKETPLESHCRHSHSRLPSALRMMLCDNLGQWEFSGKSVLVGTGCSGSDAPVLALRVLVEFWRRYAPVTLEHVFSCESSPAIQNWILGHFTPRHLFENIEELPSSVAKDVISGGWLQFPRLTHSYSDRNAIVGEA